MQHSYQLEDEVIRTAISAREQLAGQLHSHAYGDLGARLISAAESLRSARATLQETK